MLKRNKSLIIVEGESDYIFIDGLRKFSTKYQIYEVKPTSKGGRKTEILNSNYMQKMLEDAIDDKYKEIFILLDLKTQKPNTKIHFQDCKELKDYYIDDILKNNLYDNKVKVIIAIKELECWELLSFYNSNTESLDDCESKINKRFGGKNNLSKTQIAQSVVAKRKNIENIIKNQDFNKSLQYFLNKTDLI